MSRGGHILISGPDKVKPKRKTCKGKERKRERREREKEEKSISSHSLWPEMRFFHRGDGRVY